MIYFSKILRIPLSEYGFDHDDSNTLDVDVPLLFDLSICIANVSRKLFGNGTMRSFCPLGVVCRALHFFGFSNLTIQKAL